MRAAPIDRRGSRLGLGQHAGDGGARVEQHKQKVGASGITDAGRSGGDAHAVDGGEVRQVLRREGRDVSHGVNSLAIYWRGASMAGPPSAGAFSAGSTISISAELRKPVTTSCCLLYPSDAAD